MWARAGRVLARCTKINSADWGRYGGNGVECRIGSTQEEVFDYIVNLPGYFPGAQLDRINNLGHYEDGNLRWVTPKDNSMNRGSSITEDMLSESHLKTSSDFKRWCTVRGLSVDEFNREWNGDYTNTDSSGRKKKKYLWKRK